MTERRYNDAEVAAIFQRASEGPETVHRGVPAAVSMTLAELEEIGREVGIAPLVLRQAARGIDTVAEHTARTFLGLPLGLNRPRRNSRSASITEFHP